MKRTPPQAGQTSMEYVLVCAALAVALGVGMGREDSVLLQLLQAFRTAYQKIAYALAIAV